jgi:hypothetical protein
MAGFLDKLVVGVSKGVNTVSEGSKMLVEKAKLNTQIEDAQQEKNHLLHSMGTQIYHLQTSGEIQIEQCVELCNEIAGREQQIIQLKQQLQMLEEAKIQTVQYTQPITPPPVQNGIQCECGYINKDTAKFCARCGKPIQTQD